MEHARNNKNPIQPTPPAKEQKKPALPGCILLHLSRLMAKTCIILLCSGPLGNGYRTIKLSLYSSDHIIG
jgi:hypothetical protein